MFQGVILQFNCYGIFFAYSFQIILGYYPVLITKVSLFECYDASVIVSSSKLVHCLECTDQPLFHPDSSDSKRRRTRHPNSFSKVLLSHQQRQSIYDQFYKLKFDASPVHSNYRTLSISVCYQFFFRHNLL